MDADDGGTLMLSGSHRDDIPDTVNGHMPMPVTDGRVKRNPAIVSQVLDWEACVHSSRRDQVLCPEGSVVHFSEATIHAGVAVLGERPRYAFFFAATRPGLDRRVGWRDTKAVGPWGISRVGDYNSGARL